MIFFKHQIDSAGLLVDSAIRRYIFLLIVTHLIFFIRAMFTMTLGAKIFTFILLVFSITIWIIFKNKKTISIKYFADNGQPMSHQATLDWWNYYKHPLTASAESKNLISNSVKGTPLLPKMKTLRKLSRGRKICLKAEAVTSVVF